MPLPRIFETPLSRLNRQVIDGFKYFHLTPDQVTILGCLITSSSCFFYSRGMFFIAGWVMGIGSLLDAYDGYYARHLNAVTKFGSFLDSTLDRISEFFIYLGLLLYYPELALKVLAVAALFSSMMVSYSRARAESLGIVCSSGWFTRVIRLILLFIGSLLGRTVMRYVLAVILFGSIITFIQRILHTRRRLFTRQ